MLNLVAKGILLSPYLLELGGFGLATIMVVLHLASWLTLFSEKMTEAVFRISLRRTQF